MSITVYYAYISCIGVLKHKQYKHICSYKCGVSKYWLNSIYSRTINTGLQYILQDLKTKDTLVHLTLKMIWK